MGRWKANNIELRVFVLSGLACILMLKYFSHRRRAGTSKYITSLYKSIKDFSVLEICEVRTET